MFTGIIEAIGRVRHLVRRERAMELCIETSLDPGPIGASLAVDGVCLTVTVHTTDAVCVTVGPETLRRTTLGSLRPGDSVNLERALRVGDRLGGHLVLGHVDGVGEIMSVNDVGEAREVLVRSPEEVHRYLVVKGSVAVDGISLTVNRVDGDVFGVTLIPHTTGATTLAHKRPGSRVNLEADIIGKYVERFVKSREGGVTMDFLKEHGYA